MKIDVWGHDKLVADVRATLIKTVVAPLKNLSDAVVVPFSKEDLATVKPQSGHKNSLGYYFRFTMDTNGDGQSGPGDYGWDFIKTDMMFFDENQTGEQDIQIHLKKKLI